MIRIIVGHLKPRWTWCGLLGRRGSVVGICARHTRRIGDRTDQGSSRIAEAGINLVFNKFEKQ